MKKTCVTRHSQEVIRRNTINKLQQQTKYFQNEYDTQQHDTNVYKIRNISKNNIALTLNPLNRRSNISRNSFLIVRDTNKYTNEYKFLYNLVYSSESSLYEDISFL